MRRPRLALQQHLNLHVEGVNNRCMYTTQLLNILRKMLPQLARPAVRQRQFIRKLQETCISLAVPLKETYLYSANIIYNAKWNRSSKQGYQ